MSTPQESEIRELRAALTDLFNAVRPFDMLIEEDCQRIIKDDTGDYSKEDKQDAKKVLRTFNQSMSRAATLTIISA